ncbi:hypothetical protein CDIK_1870 [Cucumispora dikerogammari]|nr:hypothetical protein CDIK_1870 [Cucumispora dikerogammari]
MLILIFILSIISDHENILEEEHIDAKILECVDEKGNLVELPFTNKNITYKLNFYHEETRCILSLNLFINYTLNTYTLYAFKQLVKCTDNIGMNSFKDDYGIRTNPYKDVYQLKYYFNTNKTNNNLIYTVEAIIDTKTVARSRKYYKKYSDSMFPYINSHGQNNLKPITQFRKELGIKGSIIKTTKFKFKFRLILSRLDKKGEITIYIETKPFNFNESEDGCFFLEKEVKHPRCVNLSNAEN